MEEHLNTFVIANSKDKGKQPLSIRFLNLTNPNDATKSDALTAIRSHVARNTHGRKQESRRTRLEIRQYRPATRGSKTDNSTQPSQETSEPNLPVVHQEKNQRRSSLSDRPEIQIPNPQTFVTSHRRNPFQTTYRKVTASEDSLIDHCKYNR